MYQIGSDRRWYYELDWQLNDDVPLGDVSVLAVFVDSDGDALSVKSVANVTP